MFEGYKITTDSRDCPRGSVFLALKGEKFDGNRFAATALDKGCSFAIIDDPQYAVNGDNRYVVVKNCLDTYKTLAQQHRRRFDIPIIAITGTNGKTTTKELVAAVLSQKYNVLKTEGNFNNDVGVPQTLLRLSDEHDIAVVEMGASHPGDIKTLVETTEPQYGLITNVGRAHLQGFGSFDGVIQTKGELYAYLREHKGEVFINTDDRLLMSIANGMNLIRYGNDGEIMGSTVACDPFLRLRWRKGNMGEWHYVSTHLVGSYNLYNILAAISIGDHFHIEPWDIDNAISQYTPSNNRSQLIVTGSNHLIVDAYNANPTSMEASLKNFSNMKVNGKMAILGQMGELGQDSDAEHDNVIRLLEELGINETWLVGENFIEAAKRVDCDFKLFHNVEDVKVALANNKPQDKYILIKGSNSVKLAQLKDLL